MRQATFASYREQKGLGSGREPVRRITGATTAREGNCLYGGAIEIESKYSGRAARTFLCCHRISTSSPELRKSFVKPAPHHPPIALSYRGLFPPKSFLGFIVGGSSCSLSTDLLHEGGGFLLRRCLGIVLMYIQVAQRDPTKQPNIHLMTRTRSLQALR